MNKLTVTQTLHQKMDTFANADRALKETEISKGSASRSLKFWPNLSVSSNLPRRLLSRVLGRFFSQGLKPTYVSQRVATVREVDKLISGLKIFEYWHNFVFEF